MKIYHDGKEISTVEKELEEMLRVKIRAESTYNNTIYIISRSRDETERQAARMIMFAVGRILGYPDEEIEQDIKEAYGIE
ncbi:hypothetical protein [Megamonas hypermegale]|uniref:hypothetical protein n=1 Tax=Megamonas hypermegale TaxID=158847 RepID=UPI0026E9C6D3|nr:hypothetical protein [Megamonas hypermegale]